jgi:hypothetical protein
MYTKAEADAKIVALSPPATKAHVDSLGIAASSITGDLPAISGANLTGIDSVVVSTGGPSSPSIGKLWYDTSDSSSKVLKIYDGTSWARISSAVAGSPDNPANSIQVLYDVNTASGSMVWMSLSTYNSGNAFQVKYSTYDSKGWIEVLWSSNTSMTTPWGKWTGTGNSALLTHGVDANGSIQYSGVTSSSIAVGSAFNITDFAMTTKSSITGDTVSPTGNNENSTYPIRKANILGSSAVAAQTKVLDYWSGTGSSVHIGNSTGDNIDYYTDTNAYLQSTVGGVTAHYELMLGRRGGDIPGTEWGIDGHGDPGSTYAANWGYRNTSSTYGGSFVGSWHSSTNPKTGYEIGATNVMSLWITSM